MRYALLWLALCSLPCLASADPPLEDLEVDDFEDDVVLGGCFSVEPDPEVALEWSEEEAYELEGSVAAMVEELAGKLSPEDAKALRDGYYEWQLGRDLFCADVGRAQHSRQAEADCILAYTGRLAFELAKAEGTTDL